MGSMSAAPIDRQVRGSLSPSRAADFLTCPLLFRFRTIDRLPEQLLPRRGARHAGAQGPGGHLRPAGRRADARRRSLDARAGVGDPSRRVLAGPRAWRAPSTRRPGWRPPTRSLDRWFALEDPTRLEPAEREAFVEACSTPVCCCAASSTGSTWRRTAGSGWSTTRSGLSVAEGFEARALFQLRFYALMIWRTRGVIPRMLQLVYLGAQRDRPLRARRGGPARDRAQGEAIWAAIRGGPATGEFQPSPGRNCDWCAHHALCPVFGGTSPPMPKPPSLWARLKRQVRRRWRRVRRRVRRTVSPPSSASSSTVSALQGLPEHPTRAVEHRHVVLDDQHGQPAASADLAPVLESSMARQSTAAVLRARPLRSGTARGAACRAPTCSPVTTTRKVSGGRRARIGATNRW